MAAGWVICKLSYFHYGHFMNIHHYGQFINIHHYGDFMIIHHYGQFMNIHHCGHFMIIHEFALCDYFLHIKSVQLNFKLLFIYDILLCVTEQFYMLSFTVLVMSCKGYNE